MKRKVTKLLSMMLILAMTMSMVACGSSKKTSSKDSDSDKKVESLSAEELVNKMGEATKAIEGLSAKADINAKLSMSGSEMSLKGTMDVSSIIDPMQTYANIDITMDAMGQEVPLKVETYEVLNDKVVDSYTLTDGEWSYESLDASDYLDGADDIASSLDEIDFDKVSEFFDKIDANTKSGNYELVMEVSTKTLMSKLSDAGLTDSLGDVDLSVIPDATVTMTMSIDGETFLPKSMKVALEMDKVEYEGMEIELKTFEFNLTFDSYEDIEITIPEDALAAKDNA